MTRSKVEALYGTPLPYEALIAWIGEHYGSEAEAEARVVYLKASKRYNRAATLRAAGIRLRTYHRTYGDDLPARAAEHVAKLKALLVDPQGYIDGGEDHTSA